MDGKHVDSLMRWLTTTGTQRRAFAGLMLGALCCLGGWDSTGEALAKKGKGKKGKGKKKRGNPPGSPLADVPVSAAPLAPAPLPPGPPPAGTEVEVRIVDSAFSPTTVDVAAGTTVVWTNAGRMTHTVTADNGSFDSGSLAPGRTFPHTFATPGEYAYHCTPHPFMTALVRVS